MAQKVQVILVDDMDGGSADETVSFSLDGVSYEIDLSTKNAAAFRDSLAQYVGTARKVGGRSGGRGIGPQAFRRRQPDRADPGMGPQQRPQGERARPHPGHRDRGLQQGRRRR